MAGMRDQIQKRVDQKKQEIAELELRIREARAYILGMEEVLRLVPRDSTPATPDQALRPGTGIYKAREAIKKAGRPLHIGDILKLIGLEVNKKTRVSLSGSLAGYARRGEVFTRPAPNTFGLVEFGPQSTAMLTEPPEEFGDDNEPGQQDNPRTVEATKA